MTKFFRSILIISALSAFNVKASPQLSGEITELWVNDNSSTNVVFVSVGQTYTTSCSNDPRNYLIIDLSQASMKEAYSMALSAFVSGKPVVMRGINGSCYGSNEKLKYIYMTN